MRNKTFKKMLAGMLAVTMAMGMNMVAFAADASSTGDNGASGDLTYEGHVDKTIPVVVFPTVPEGTFDFIVDPEGLIQATNAEKYGDATFTGDTGVYFLSGTNTYTADSTKLKVYNKGTEDMNITIKAKVEGATGVTMADSATFADSNDTKDLYIGLKVADQAPTAVKDSEVTVAVALAGIEENYETTYDSDEQKYVFSVKSDLEDKNWNSFEFGLTGACEAEDDWSELTMTTPKVTLTWEMAVRTADNSDGVTMLTENATTGPSVETGHANWDSSANVWLGADSSTGFTGEITEFKLNGNACEFTNTDGWLKVTWAQISAADSDATEYVFTFKVDGVDYTATPVSE